jgi:hypothetical protein
MGDHAGMKRNRRSRLALWLALTCVAVLAARAFVMAAVPHSFNNGETLQAADLNGNFAALDQRIGQLESREPFAGTYPAVLGLGLGPWYCGAAPPTLNVGSAAPAGPLASSSAFGSVVFTSGGALSLNVSSPAPCPTPNLCSSPVTFFLRSPKAQTLVIKTFLDDAGAIYVDGSSVASNLGAQTNSTSINVPAGPFALSFLACSNNGPSNWLSIYDAFLTSADYGLAVDFDRVFHRGGH